MTADRPASGGQSGAVKPRGRRRATVDHLSRTTIDPAALPDVDNRTTWARRRRDLIRGFMTDLARGGRTLTVRETTLASNAAAITVKTEQMAAAIARGEPVDTNELVRLCNVLARVLAALGIGSKAVVLVGGGGGLARDLRRIRRERAKAERELRARLPAGAAS